MGFPFKLQGTHPTPVTGLYVLHKKGREYVAAYGAKGGKQEFLCSIRLAQEKTLFYGLPVYRLWGGFNIDAAADEVKEKDILRLRY